MPDAPTADVAQELSEHKRHHDEHGGRPGTRHDRALVVIEAVMLSLVALVAAWSGYCAAEWSTKSSDLLADSQETQAKADTAKQEALQLRTFDSVAFDAAFDAYVSKDRPAFRLAVKRLRPAYREAFEAWLATRPLTNPHARRDPSLMPQYRIAEEGQARRLARRAHAQFEAASRAGDNSDRYVRVTVILASVLFILGISGHFPVRSARFALIGIAGILIAYSVVELIRLPGLPS